MPCFIRDFVQALPRAAFFAVPQQDRQALVPTGPLNQPNCLNNAIPLWSSW